MSETITMVATRSHLAPDGSMVHKGDDFKVTASQEKAYESAPHLAVPKGARAAAPSTHEPPRDSERDSSTGGPPTVPAARHQPSGPAKAAVMRPKREANSAGGKK